MAEFKFLNFSKDLLFVFTFLGVLDEEADDTLVNVNIMDEERVERNLKNLRDIKAGGYNPYEEEIDPLTGDLSKKGKICHIKSVALLNGHIIVG